ncbi:hypothetical protein AB0912_31320 [Streptomyces sp. NPDC007084]|uniref:hypothetical protein n=1 Tax=Streptomyces sp. NPDC007084 TaxID=3154313 RepID=UPI0034560B65
MTVHCGEKEETAREQWEQRGLLFSRVDDSEQVDGRAALYRVEARLQGSRWGALSEAERRVMAALAGRVTAQIGDATLLKPEEARTAASTWHMYRKTERGPGWASRLWVQVGAADLHRQVRLEGPGTREEALAALRLQPDLSGVDFDEDRHDVRPGTASAHALRPRDPAPWQTRAMGLPSMGVCAGVMLFGWVLAG